MMYEVVIQCEGSEIERRGIYELKRFMDNFTLFEITFNFGDDRMYAFGFDIRVDIGEEEEYAYLEETLGMDIIQLALNTYNAEGFIRVK